MIIVWVIVSKNMIIRRLCLMYVCIIEVLWSDAIISWVSVTLLSYSFIIYLFCYFILYLFSYFIFIYWPNIYLFMFIFYSVLLFCNPFHLHYISRKDCLHSVHISMIYNRRISKLKKMKVKFWFEVTLVHADNHTCIIKFSSLFI